LVVNSPGVLANDTGSGLTAELVTPPTNHSGTFTLNADGSFTYVLRSNPTSTTDSFTYRAKNGTTSSTPATVTINITPPSGTPDSYQVTAPGGSTSGNVLTNDTPSTGLTAEIVTLPAHHTGGALTLNTNGSFTYNHDGAGGVTDSFTYRAKIGALASNPVTVTININQPPVAPNACISTPSNYVAGNSFPNPSGKLPGSDPNGGSPLFSIPVPNVSTKGTATTDSAGNFSYQPINSSVRGMDKFTFTVTDSQNPSLTATGTAWVFIGGTNNNPAPAVRIMPLGDSITEGITDGNNNKPDPGFRVGYRLPLYNALTTAPINDGKYGVDFVGGQSEGGSAGLSDTNHDGHPGWCDATPPACGTGQGIAENLNAFLTSNPADIVLLHIGTNSFDTSNTGVASILGNADSWAGSNHPIAVFVARIIQNVSGTLDVTTFNNNVAAIAQDGTNTTVLMVNQQTGAGLNYTIDSSATCLNTGACSGDMADDLHPNPSGYNKLAQKWKTDLVNSGILPNCP
jgi:lysophospholipase L1-like esterase